MKGIILAGGTGSRLNPMTKAVSKQLLPVYDKPMIYYPLATLMLFGIKDFLIISTPHDIGSIESLFGDGSYLGISIQYKIQQEPNGIAQAFILGEDFITKYNPEEDVCLILGDNIFYMGEQYHYFDNIVNGNADKIALVFAYHVSDPERFGVVEFDKDQKVISIEEKPLKPKSNYAVVGLYFYPSDVATKAKSLTPSARGEYEITDLNNIYLNEGRLSVIPMKRGNAWLDAGTPNSLLKASQYVQIIEERQGLKIACIEEIALRRGFISLEQFSKIIDSYAKCRYKEYLEKIYNEYKE